MNKKMNKNKKYFSIKKNKSINIRAHFAESFLAAIIKNPELCYAISPKNKKRYQVQLAIDYADTLIDALNNYEEQKNAKTNSL